MWDEQINGPIPAISRSCRSVFFALDTLRLSLWTLRLSFFLKNLLALRLSRHQARQKSDEACFSPALSGPTAAETKQTAVQTVVEFDVFWFLIAQTESNV